MDIRPVTRLVPGLIATVLLASGKVFAAPVVETSSRTVFSPPTASELADATDLVLSSGPPPGSLVIALRTAPSRQVNPGLDAPIPALVEGADTLELGMLQLPEPSDTCPDNTPVTITISDWSLTLLNADPGVSGAGGGGGGLLDSRDPTVSAPATAATANGVSNPSTIGGTNIVGGRQYFGTFADLPFLTFAATINAVRISSLAPVQSYYQAVVPTLTLEYDDATCSSAASGAVSVPVMGPLHLLLLIAGMPVLVLLAHRVWRGGGADY